MKKGYTLVELMVCVVVLAVIAISVYVIFAGGKFDECWLSNDPFMCRAIKNRGF